MFQLGDIVRFEDDSFPKWAGEIREIKIIDSQLTLYRVKFDPNFNSREAFLATAKTYESYNMPDDAERLKRLADAAIDGSWHTEKQLKLASDMKIGFNA